MAKGKDKKKLVYTNAKKRAESRNTGGWTPTAFKIPDGWDLMKFEKAGTYECDILPTVAGPSNQGADEGNLTYEMTYYVHKDVGPLKKTLTCMQRTFGKKCYGCQQEAKARAQGASKEALSAIRAKARQLFVMRNREEDKKKFRLYEAAYKGGPGAQGFGEMIESELDMAADNDPVQTFYALEGGQTLTIRTKEDKYNGRTFYKPTKIKFSSRKEDYPDSILEDMPVLDELVIPIGYEEFKKEWEGEDEEKPKGKSKSKPDDDEDDEDDDKAESDDDSDDDDNDDSDDGDEDYTPEVGDTVEFEVRGKTKKGKVVRVVKKNETAEVETDDRKKPGHMVEWSDLTKVESDDDDDDSDDDDEDEKPKGKGKGKETAKPKGKTKPKDEDDEDEDEDEDEEESDADEDDEDDDDSDSSDDDDDDDSEDDDDGDDSEDEDEDDDSEDDEDDEDDEDEDEDDEDDEPKVPVKKRGRS